MQTNNTAHPDLLHFPPPGGRGLLTFAQLSRIHVLLAQTNNIEHKADIVEGFTEGRTFHSSEMTQQEAFNMIDHLVSLQPLKTVLDDAKNKMRRKIISMAYEMGWAPPGKWKDAIAAIDNFCKGEHSIFKKSLNRHSHKELVQVVSQFEAMYKKHLKQF
jgi:hypothetical protein